MKYHFWQKWHDAHHLKKARRAIAVPVHTARLCNGVRAGDNARLAIITMLSAVIVSRNSATQLLAPEAYEFLPNVKASERQ
ncbi:hypothetical protein ACWXWB_17300 [Pantoea dispersa]|uniref:hypothetical protein n=1 Tax=Pantoea dispersa TaxID=59814 RepID=UPI002DBDD815|nr:hypothetical protein [Pantoea dispersa]MEB5971535.1 hypothetical protein [Pantoea dispersa]